MVAFRWNGILCYYGYIGKPSKSSATWDTPQVRTSAVVCPEGVSTGEVFNTNQGWWTNYAGNQNVFTYEVRSALKLASFRTPSSTFAITEGNSSSGGLISRTNWEERISYRHSLGANILYLDGHCAWLKYNQIPDTSYSNRTDPFWYEE